MLKFIKFFQYVLNKSSLLLFLAISTILVSGSLSVDIFADHKQSHQSNAGGVPSLQSQVDKLDGHVTVLKEQADINSESTARADSFFDVFFDVELYAVESFFDIFTELQDDVSEIKGDIFGDPDFDLLFGDPDKLDGHVTVLKTQVNTLEEETDKISIELVALSLRGESCEVGKVVTGFDADNNPICTTDAIGSTDTTALQKQIDGIRQEMLNNKNAHQEQIADIRTEMLNNKNALQAQIDDIRAEQLRN